MSILRFLTKPSFSYSEFLLLSMAGSALLIKDAPLVNWIAALGLGFLVVLLNDIIYSKVKS